MSLRGGNAVRRARRRRPQAGIILAALTLGIIGLAYAYVTLSSTRSTPYSLVMVFDPQIAGEHVELYARMSYSLSVTVNVMTAGAFGNTSHLIVLELDRLYEAPEVNSSFLTIRGPRGWTLDTGVYVFPENNTVVVGGSTEEGLAKAFDRLLLAITGDCAIDVDPSGNYLVVEVPGRGHRVGVPWVDRFRLAEVADIPVYGGTDADVAHILLNGLVVEG